MNSNEKDVNKLAEAQQKINAKLASSEAAAEAPLAEGLVSGKPIYESARVEADSAYTDRAKEEA